MNSRIAVTVLFTSSIGWGLTWLPIKTLIDLGLDSMYLVFIAFVSAAAIMLPWLVRQFSNWHGYMGTMLMIALMGGIANVSFQFALYHGEVIRIMILFYLLPVWSVIGGWLFLKEKIDVLRLTAVIICLSGASFILDVWNSSWQSIGWVDLLAIGSGMAFAATNILFRFSQQLPVMSKISSLFLGSAVLSGFVMLNMNTLAELPSLHVIGWAIAYGALWLTLITLGTQWAVTQMEAGRAAIIIVMELVAAVVSVALLTRTDLQVYEILGALMVIGAALLEGSRAEKQMMANTCP